MLAAKCYELAESLDADDEWDERNAESDRAEALLATALDTDGQQLYALFDPPPDDDEDAEYEWYRRLGYDTLEDWLNREPWWQREGYSSEAEAELAEADYDDDDDEIKEGNEHVDKRKPTHWDWLAAARAIRDEHRTAGAGIAIRAAGRRAGSCPRRRPDQRPG